jgi:hypothetical protein
MKRLLALCTLLLQIGTASAQQKPNVIVILVDDMGWGDQQCFNPQSKITTPIIDNLAAKESNARLPGGIVLGADPIGTQRGIIQAARPVPATHPYRARPGHAQSQSHVV